MGVRNILEGSVRKSRDRLRITAQLVDTQTGDHIWAERYDRKTDDLFEIQDEIARKIVEELQVNLGVGEAFRFVAGRAKTIEAWELVVRAAPLTDTLVCNDTKKARELITRALEIDPEYSGAWAIMGWVHWLESVFNWSTDSKKSLGLALEAAEKAVELDPQNPEGYSLLGSTYLVLGDIDRAIEMCKRAIEIAPANSYGVAILANALIDSGEIKQGIVKIKKAIRLCPFPPGWYFSLLGTGLHLDGKHEEALKPLEIAISREPDSHLPRLWLVSALVELNRIDDAKKVAQQILEIEPDFSALDWAATYKAKSHGRLKDNMLAAGFIQ